jgi:hypothetical protein
VASIEREKEVTLYFRSNGYPMVACIHSAVDVTILDCKQYYLDMLGGNISICIDKLP